MAEITVSMVKDLRLVSGAGIMDCKSALSETNGDVEAAIDWLRTKGLAKATQKAGRIAVEGLVAVAAENDVSGSRGVVLEVNSETDFVARNTQFQEMVSHIAMVALSSMQPFEDLTNARFPGTDKTVAAHVQEMIGTIGENMTFRRAAHLEVSAGVVGHYIHNQVSDHSSHAVLGKIGVLVALESSGDHDALAVLAKKIAMHVAAARPLALDKESLSAEAITRERAVLTQEAVESGKPPQVVEKMVEGRLRKYFEDVVLGSQIFVIDGERRIEQVIADETAALGVPIKLTDFVRYELGEGIDKSKSADFASEVSDMAR